MPKISMHANFIRIHTRTSDFKNLTTLILLNSIHVQKNYELEKNTTFARFNI